jgi:hypothetical protein
VTICADDAVILEAKELNVALDYNLELYVEEIS